MGQQAIENQLNFKGNFFSLVLQRFVVQPTVFPKLIGWYVVVYKSTEDEESQFDPPSLI